MAAIARIACLLLVASATGACMRAGSARVATCEPELATETLTVVSAIGSVTQLTVEIAATDADRATGLAGRDAIPAGCGMLFRYPAPTRNAFWMRGVHQSLDIAFIGPDGRIAEVVTLQPCGSACPRHAPAEAYESALEVRGGLLAELGIAVGDRVED
jgi:uncharacterized membrane protein (UPF0127 family)